MERLDSLDFKIIELMKEPGSVAPNVTFIAEKLNKPIATIHGRIRRLERKGVIEKYSGVISNKKTGTEIISFLLIQAPTGMDFNDYGKKLSKIKEIYEVNYVVGEWAFVCKIRAKDMDDYTEIISRINKEANPLKMQDIISPKTFKKEA
jgi:DNA-binding Lrp family transcriptional regulator